MSSGLLPAERQSGAIGPRRTQTHHGASAVPLHSDRPRAPLAEAETVRCQGFTRERHPVGIRREKTGGRHGARLAMHFAPGQPSRGGTARGPELVASGRRARKTGRGKALSRRRGRAFDSVSSGPELSLRGRLTIYPGKEREPPERSYNPVSGRDDRTAPAHPLGFPPNSCWLKKLRNGAAKHKGSST